MKPYELFGFIVVVSCVKGTRAVIRFSTLDIRRVFVSSLRYNLIFITSGKLLKWLASTSVPQRCTHRGAQRVYLFMTWRFGVGCCSGCVVAQNGYRECTSSCTPLPRPCSTLRSSDKMEDGWLLNIGWMKCGIILLQFRNRCLRGPQSISISHKRAIGTRMCQIVCSA